MIAALVAASLAATCPDAYCRKRVNASNPDSAPLQWPGNTAITWHVSLPGDNEIPGDAESVAIESAFAAWQAVFDTCSSLQFVKGAPTSRRDIGWTGLDPSPQNLLVFREKRCDAVVPAGTTCTGNGDCANTWDCWEYDKGVLALTTTSYHPTLGTIYDADVEFNLPSFIFTAVDTPVCPPGACNVNCVCSDVQNTTTHEIGHMLGLDHSTQLGSIMAARAEPGELSKRVIDPGTASFVCDVYPSTGLLKVPHADGRLGPVGCASAPGAALAVLAAAWLRRGRGRA